MPGNGLTFWPTPRVRAAIGADRAHWWVGTPGSSVSGATASDLSNWWDSVRPGDGRMTVTNLGGTTLTMPRAWTAGLGSYILRANGGGGFLGHGMPDSRIALAQPFDIPAPVPPPRETEILVLREDMQALAGTEMVCFLGGFCVGSNAMWGSMAVEGILTGNAFRGVGIVRDGTGTYVMVKSSAALITLLPITVDVTTRAVFEHRLISPTVSAPGRYELRVNDVLIESVSGDHANWPQVASSAERVVPVPFARNVPGASGATGARCFYSEVYAGPNTPGTTEN